MLFENTLNWSTERPKFLWYLGPNSIKPITKIDLKCI